MRACRDSIWQYPIQWRAQYHWTHPCTECICGLAAAVTDLLQSVQLEYHGYQGDSNGGDGKGPPKDQVTQYLNGLFSLVQGLGGTAVVRTYIDQLAQVLSALVGWSEIVKCWGSGGDGSCNGGGTGNEHGQNGTCEYLEDVKPNTPCTECKCMKWDVTDPNSQGTPLGRKCQRCSDSGDDDTCKCSTPGVGACSPGKCKCAIEGKCCKCCCTGCSGKCNEKAKCSCDKKGSYKSAYTKTIKKFSYVEEVIQDELPTWKHLTDAPTGTTTDGTASQRRHHCARIFLGSVCLIWSGLTYMYWTGKWAKGSPRWNNHILDGSGLDDGTLSQWLQALGFPRDMLNNSGPGNRWDAVIWDGFRGMLYLGFPDTTRGGVHGYDTEDNTFRNPAGMNYAGYIHTVDRGAFCSKATVFHKNGTDSSTTDTNTNKCGALYKLYILSCAYFTGLQKKTPPKAENKTPRTIREILYWLSALPYSQAYPEILKHGKHRLTEVLKKPGDTASTTEQSELKFHQTGRNHPITVHEFNLFAHFQAVTQYCPLVLIGIQGGIHSTNRTTEPAIHSLYANTECHFTYPTVSIQAYNQVVHYIRALFYQLYFLRKQCAVKVTCGGKWRECRYGDGVLGKDVVSWMCLGCSPMEHDRRKRVGMVGDLLKGVKTGDAEKLKALLVAIGEVVVQLGNAQEALEGKKTEAIEKVKEKLGNAKGALDSAKGKLEGVNSGLNGKLGEAKGKLEALTESGDKGALDTLANGNGPGSLQQVATASKEYEKDYSSAKDNISAAIDGIHKVLEILKEGVEKQIKEELKEAKSALDVFHKITNIDSKIDGVFKQEISHEYTALLQAINKLKDICSTPKCPGCTKHSDKCGQPSNPTVCQTCLQPTTTGVPSPLQAFLEDRLPGFSCDVVRNTDTDKDTVYPPAASHLGHCNGSGQCCPLPMGFRSNFQDGVTNTGARLYGILYFFSNENMMQSCVYTLVRVTAALSATTPQVLGDVFGFFRGGVGNKERGEGQQTGQTCNHTGNPSTDAKNYFCGWCASGLRDVVKQIEWIPLDSTPGGQYMGTVGKALIDIKGDNGTGNTVSYSNTNTTPNNLSALTDGNHYVSPLTGELYTAVSATFGGTYLSWVLYLSDALQWGLESLSEAFQQIECRSCKGNCDPNKCRKGSHGASSDGQCGCQSIVSCTGVLPVLYRHGFSYGNPFNLEGYQQEGEKNGDYSIEKKDPRLCHQFLDSLSAVINKKKESDQKDQDHPLTNLLKQVGQLQYDIRLPWIFVLTVAWLVAVLYLAFGAIWPLDWTHMRSHWLRGGEHQWQCMWYKVMTGRKGMELVEYFGKRV